MKKRLLVFGAAICTFCFTAYAYMNWNKQKACSEVVSCSSFPVLDNELSTCLNKPTPPDLEYKVGSRFIWTVTKENLNRATSIVDILPKDATQQIAAYKSTEVSILDREGNTIIAESGLDAKLNAAQKRLLLTADYSTSILIRADYKQRNESTGVLEDQYLTYYYTIIPEKQAEYSGGTAALIEYLRSNSQSETGIISEDRLKPGQVRFTITKNGDVAGVTLSATSGYPTIDKLLVELVSKMPGKWHPAKDAAGTPVNQELIFFFGKVGC